MRVRCWLLLAAPLFLALEALISPPSDEDLQGYGEDFESMAVELPLMNGGTDPDGNASSLLDTESEAGRSDTGVWRCFNYCVKCQSGVAWQISRSQPTARKLSKGFAGVYVASWAVMLVAVVGLMFFSGMGAVFLLGAWLLAWTTAYLSLGGAMIGIPYLFNTQQDRACPVVGFAELLPENAGILSGIATDFADGWRQMFSSQPKEQRYSLADLNYYELLLRVPGADEGKLKNHSATLIKGERARIDEKERLRMALACNIMTFHNKLWTHERKKTHKVDRADARKIELAIVKECGEWLCNGENSVAHASVMGFFSRCRAWAAIDMNATNCSENGTGNCTENATDNATSGSVDASADKPKGEEDKKEPDKGEKDKKEPDKGEKDKKEPDKDEKDKNEPDEGEEHKKKPDEAKPATQDSGGDKKKKGKKEKDEEDEDEKDEDEDEEDEEDDDEKKGKQKEGAKDGDKKDGEEHKHKKK